MLPVYYRTVTGPLVQPRNALNWRFLLCRNDPASPIHTRYHIHMDLLAKYFHASRVSQATSKQEIDSPRILLLRSPLRSPPIHPYRTQVILSLPIVPDSWYSFLVLLILRPSFSRVSCSSGHELCLCYRPDTAR